MSEYQRYVAIGDSFTEGVGDPDPTGTHEYRGWSDRVAEVMAARDPEFGYANLAIRGKKMGQIVDEQLEPALALRPDLVTVYAGANDLIRPQVDIDEVIATYDELIGTLIDAGSTVLMWTAADSHGSGIFGALRGRFAIYNELVREIAERRGALLLDYWRMTEYRDLRMWEFDRIHMSEPGHLRMAIEVLDVLGVPHALEKPDLGPAPEISAAEDREIKRKWRRDFAYPWVVRRVRGISTGDGLPPKYPTLMRPVGVDA
ncbi:Lipolytic protein G-D-S-L family OS=Tsukamurella paurometabola (strain ATCC 8368 / DSM / CCUG 35730 / CIP 100753 / JCM 10117 / KCTC 9821 / NBRC 16120 /NCIMB 702349 / NCTC 13040) OX=521096 GN=Tpau_1065 PE=4 SV=1 [Tsukamurella paurometabola]|uniref:Lipolytic protein G-D-S-L family n=1 Tax=Tsukamurella paurometabola (strain ATCC 8368 / DSM 20162 / CCUG 35730 / CIP 100753 / JCM 10117 / KCTC 9821 / NBRC 16120 / NCIMB 702349 / NCTC 13040) TaxID=521096 RepID=D5UVA7_TSUPD|nr:SGNH/GDSL hydrolase family protein [Tsukamurella paurometabola]ADG77697.1 lipolytic protein G-D-S-L family [Tsukamurella paurometabola DSM 20162]SUP28352.1 GDSL-like Lipase/Acylhydrolase [Tsukamurella paurometabola]